MNGKKMYKKYRYAVVFLIAISSILLMNIPVVGCFFMFDLGGPYIAPPGEPVHFHVKIIGRKSNCKIEIFFGDGDNDTIIINKNETYISHEYLEVGNYIAYGWANDSTGLSDSSRAFVNITEPTCDLKLASVRDVSDKGYHCESDIVIIEIIVDSVYQPEYVPTSYNLIINVSSPIITSTEKEYPLIAPGNCQIDFEDVCEGCTCWSHTVRVTVVPKDANDTNLLNNVGSHDFIIFPNWFCRLIEIFPDWIKGIIEKIFDL